MKRRSFLLSGATALGAAIAGCNSGGPSQGEYKTVQQRLSEARSEKSNLESQLAEVRNQLNQTKGSLSDTRSELNQTKGSLSEVRSELDSREQDLQNARQTITDYENRISSVRTEVAQARSTIDSKEQLIQELETSLSAQETATEDQKKKIVLWFYGYGITLQNAAVSSYNNGYDHIENGDYILASESFAAASGQYDGASVLFNEAYDRASAFGYSSVLSYCSDSERAMELMRKAVVNYEIGSRRLAQGKSTDSYFSDGDDYFNKRQDFKLVRRGVLENELGVTVPTE